MDVAIQTYFNGEVGLWEIIIASICFSIFFVDIHRFYMKWHINFKPFNCASCLAGWTALFLLFVPVLVKPMIVMFVSGVIVIPAKLLIDIIYKNSK